MFGWGDFGGEKMGGGGVFSLGLPLFYTPKLEKYVGERGGIYCNYHSTPTICHQFFIPLSTFSILSLFSSTKQMSFLFLYFSPSQPNTLRELKISLLSSLFHSPPTKQTLIAVIAYNSGSVIFRDSSPHH